MMSAEPRDFSARSKGGLPCVCGHTKNGHARGAWRDPAHPHWKARCGHAGCDCRDYQQAVTA